MGTRRFHRPAEDNVQEAPRQTASDQTGFDALASPAGPAAWGLVPWGGTGILQLPRGPRQHQEPRVVPVSGGPDLVACITSPEPMPPDELGEIRADCRSLATNPQGPASLSQPTLLRQTPEIGAVCGNSARTDLCGGCPQGWSLPRPHDRLSTTGKPLDGPPSDDVARLAKNQLRDFCRWGLRRTRRPRKGRE